MIAVREQRRTALPRRSTSQSSLQSEWPPARPCTIAVDAGTTGVRALVVDDRARVVDVAYRELTQHFPRPGWVEHDADEIWEPVRSTLDEVAGRLADQRPGGPGHRHHQPARDRGGLGPAHR